MKIKDIMSASPAFLLSTATIQEAAQKMAEIDCGFLPVGGGNDKLVGTVTDRDIAIRAVAKGLAPTAKVTEIMTNQVKYCTQDDTIEAVAENMAENQIRRLVVLNNRKEKRLVGVVSIGDLVTARSTKPETCQTVIKGVSQPSQKKRQAA
jgi:CBS domain-containing protein